MGQSNSLGPRTFREPELLCWGERVGELVSPPLWVALDGPLGSGKSVLVRAICRGAGIAGHIPSPSFTLVQQYTSPRGFRIYHVDLFRLRPGEPIDPLGWEDLLSVPGLVLLEWARRAGDQQPEDRWEITLEYGAGPEERIVTASRVGTAAELIRW